MLRFALPYCSCFEEIYYEWSIQKYSEGCPQTDPAQNGGRHCLPALFYYHMDIHGSVSDWVTENTVVSIPMHRDLKNLHIGDHVHIYLPVKATVMTHNDVYVINQVYAVKAERKKDE